MDKQILEQYIDACELVEEAKEELRRLKKQRKRIEQDIVKGLRETSRIQHIIFMCRGSHIRCSRIPGAWRYRKRYYSSALRQRPRSVQGGGRGCSQYPQGCSGLSGIEYSRN